MLILGRKTGEKIVMTVPGPEGTDVNITLTVVRQLNGSVSLGIDAPRSVVIDREEIAELKRETHHRKRDASPPTKMASALNSAIQLSQRQVGNVVGQELAAQLTEGRLRAAQEVDA